MPWASSLAFERREPLREARAAHRPVAGLLVPAGVENERLDPHPGGDVDLREHPLRVHRLEVRLPVPPLVALLEVPGVVVDAGRAGLRVRRELVADEAAVGLGRPVLVAGHEAGLHPDRVVGVVGVHDLAAPVVALDRRAASPRGRGRGRSAGRRRGPASRARRRGAASAARRRRRGSAPSTPRPASKSSGSTAPLRERVAVEELDELGEAHLPRPGQAGEGRARGTRVSSSRAGAREGVRPRAVRRYWKRTIGPVLGEAEAHLEARARDPRAACRGSGTPRRPVRGATGSPTALEARRQRR